MIAVMNRIPVKEAFREDFESRFKNRAGLVDQSPGFVRNLILRPAQESSDYHVVLTIWENEAAFTDWTKSEAFKKAHQKAGQTPREMYKGPNVLEMFEIISDTETAA